MHYRMEFNTEPSMDEFFSRKQVDRRFLRENAMRMGAVWLKRLDRIVSEGRSVGSEFKRGVVV